MKKFFLLLLLALPTHAESLLGVDKAAHLGIGCLLTDGFHSVTKDEGLSFGCTMTLELFKESTDRTGFSLLDVAFTAAGATLSLILNEEAKP